MRVLITTDAVGGVWAYTTTMADALAACGDAVFVAVVGEPSDAQVAGLPEGVEWEAAPLPLEWLPSATEDGIARGIEWLRDLVGRWSADVVHLNQFAYAAEPLGAPTLLVSHSDVFSWFGEVRGAEPGPEWGAYRRWIRAGLDGADVVVSPTRYQSDLLARHYGRAADRVIHNGIAPRGAVDASPASERPFIVTAGRAWDPAKGVEVLDEALAQLGAGAPSAHLAGSLEGPAGERYVPRHLNTHGRISPAELDRLYGNAAVYVAMSLYEPFGLAPLEAASHGCALLLSDIGSFRELWADAAVFVPPASPDALAAALDALWSDGTRMDRLAAAARTRAARYGVERMVTDYRGLHARLVGGRKEVVAG